MEKQEQLTKEQLLSLYKLLEQKILENQDKFKEKKFKDDELIQLLLKTILLEEKRTKIGILKYLDLEKIDFSNQDIIYIDFTETNANIDPQTVYLKELQYAKLTGDFKGKSFDGTCICGTDFSKATNVKIDPQKVKYRKIIGAIVDGVDFDCNSFDGVETHNTDFSKAHNCKINEKNNQEIYHRYKNKIKELIK